MAIGDAIGVPFEFKSREAIRKSPVTDITGFGSHNLPPGTFSDDSSLTFCLAESLLSGYDLNDIARKFIAWRYKNYWTARNEVFDIGITTQRAIDRLLDGVRPDLAGDFDESANGNGSLMRILPLLAYLRKKPIADRYSIIRQVSSVTHGHIRSAVACFYYLEFALELLNGTDKFEIYKLLQTRVGNYLRQKSISIDEIKRFDNLLADRIDLFPEEQIKSSGYVLHTLEAAIWCLLITDNYRDAVLKAVNLGHDTDTTGAVTGGLAGLLYGYENIPQNWLEALARRDDIEELAAKIFSRYQ